MRIYILFIVGAVIGFGQPAFVGSAKCGGCHTAIYNRWKKTLMANVLQDVKAKPEVILGDFSKPNEFVTFKKEDIAFTYGSKWKQRYFTKIGNDYFAFPAQWDVKAGMWRRYYVRDGTDWWTKHYPAEQMQRPTGPTCDGCHSVNFNTKDNSVTEWNVGCEKCHGAGSTHAAAPSKATIVNPARLDFVRSNDVCIQCHSEGRPLNNPVNGRYYAWPVGYQPGARLSDYWQLEEHKLGEKSFTHYPEGSGIKNRMQGNDFVQSAMHSRGVKCSSCHDVHGTGNNADLIKPGSAMCLECHGPESPNGPRQPLAIHTQHKEGSAGSECAACHMPQIAVTIEGTNVRSHTFRFVPPGDSEKYKVPNACVICHKDKGNEWAAKELKKWPHVSPWRVAGK